MLNDTKKVTVPVPPLTIGLDVGDDRSYAFVVDADGVCKESFSVRTDREGLTQRFDRATARVVLEVGPHSRWISKHLSEMGHEVIVADPRKLGLVSKSHCKTDRRDAEILALLGSSNGRSLLGKVKHRSEEMQCDLAVLLTRDHFVRQRTMSINRVRGVLKSFGIRVPRTSSKCFHTVAAPYVPPGLRPSLLPVLEEILSLQIRIKRLDDEIKRIVSRYPQAQRLQAIFGVGPIIALAFVLSLGEAKRFKHSRDVGPFFGLTPRIFQTGRTDLQLSIARTGNPFVRRHLVQAAQGVLRSKSPDCDLKRYGKKIEESGGKHPKKRAVVAVARKLAVLMHQLLVDATPYDPWYALKRAGGTPPEPPPKKQKNRKRANVAASPPANPTAAVSRAQAAKTSTPRNSVDPRSRRQESGARARASLDVVHGARLHERDRASQSATS